MKKVLLSLFLFITLFSSFVFPVFAQSNQQDSKVLPRNTVVNKDYFSGGNSVIVSGTVNGDAFLAGNTVTVDGNIDGDLLAAGGVVNIRGNVSHNIRVAAGQVIISGNVGGNVTTLGNSVIITDNAKINGSLSSASNTLEVNGPIGRDITITANRFSLGNTVGRDANITANEIQLTPNARINGNLAYWSANKAKIDQGAVVSGKITQNIVKQKTEELDRGGILGFITAAKIIALISYLVTGLLLIRFLPFYTQRTIDTIAAKPWPSLLTGFLTIILFPLLFILIMITIIGIPLALILLATFLIFAYLAIIFTSLFVGETVLTRIRKKTSSGWALLLGLVIYEILTIIPFIGFLIMPLFVFFGLGGILLEEKNFYHQLRSKKLI